MSRRIQKRSARSWPPKPKPFPRWIPAHLSTEEKDRLVWRERNAVKEADRIVDIAWRSHGLHATPPDGRRHALDVAYSAARRAAREDFRAGVLTEIATETKVELPSHIARLTKKPDGPVIDQQLKLEGGNK